MDDFYLLKLTFTTNCDLKCMHLVQLPNSIQKEIGHHTKRGLSFTSKRIISVVGSETYELVRGLIAPRKPKELVYDNIVKEPDTHFTPSVNVIVERFKFYDFEKPQNQ